MIGGNGNISANRRFLGINRSPSEETMYLFHVFRSFLPLHNPIGFSAVDFVELAFALCLLLVLFARPPY